MQPTKITNIAAQLPKSARAIKELDVHCTAGWQDETNAALLAGFKARGWKNPGYHVTVDADGTAWLLQHPDAIANGIAGRNAHALHISYKGGIQKVGGKIVAVDNRTPQQKATMIAILKHWRTQYPSAIIQGHRDTSPDKNKNGKVDEWEYIKQCPCFNAIPAVS